MSERESRESLNHARRPTRPERAAEVAGLRAEGLTHREIAERLGISRSYAAALDTDPDGSQNLARRARYQGACIDCGSPTDGSNGRAQTPERCARCRKEFEKQELLYWTPDRLIAAAQHWFKRFGYVPAATSWGLAQTIDGYRYPNSRSCFTRGGKTNHKVPWPTWGDFLEAAGFPGFHGMGAGGYRIRRAKAAA